MINEPYLNPVNGFAQKHGPFIFIGLLLLTAVLSFTSAIKTSVTVDEFADLPTGLEILKTRAFYIDPGVPPLPKMLAAVPVLLFGKTRFENAKLRDDISCWELGYNFMEENSRNYHRIFMMGRMASIIILLILCFLAWGFAKSLHGPAGALLCAAFVCLTPDLIAHGSLTTTDIHFAAALVGSLWAFDVFLRKPGWRSALMLGAALGLATVCKFTGVLLFAVLPATALAMFFTERARPETLRRFWRSLAFGFIALGTALVVINSIYFFQGIFTILDKYDFYAGKMRFLKHLLPGWLPIPLPYWFVKGLDIQLAEGGYQAYLLGHFNGSGFWNYYLVAFLVKTPLPMIMGVVAAFFMSRRIALREIPIVTVAVFFFVFFSLAGHKNIGIRYLLFLFPIAAIWIGRIAASDAWQIKKQGNKLAIMVGVAGLCMVTSAFLVWPNYLAYFNGASGGPLQGHKYLLDSNIDWGQDLIALREYMQANNIDSINLAYFGRVKPEVYGIRYRDLPAGPPPKGWVAISANLLWGLQYMANGKPGWWPEPEVFARYRALAPKAVPGYSIYVFKIE
ncbi:MAG: glycosyltransferase family 39 protein [Chitinivibrionales bacterium]|nr:glycosyltransferase family 39 protein [Chitinivibrionales bacterium]